MATTLMWTGSVSAVSSISHGGETRGTTTMLRREQIIQPDGQPKLVPIISGNAFRGRLRRLGEELIRDALGYAGEISLPAFHALRSGGALASTGREPLSGQRLADLRRLVPQIGVFGCAGGGRIIDGCLQVGKVVPILQETAHIVPANLLPADRATIPAFNSTQIETAVRLDDAERHGAIDVVAETIPVGRSGLPELGDLSAPGHSTTILMQYRNETFPAGTRFATWLRLERATPVEVSFFAEILQRFQADGRLGGRAATGHGQVAMDLTRAVICGADEQTDWRDHINQSRHDALLALKDLT
ncbi:RAMP superfamily CRISPR-associated protein [Kribbella sp. NPDC023972]|uniref:RAMP superfamily CRISPR-associated protein n=1 Tax=Kribbella sp. NPDC023972 TaxID=3154795 RepID=UPI0033CD5FA8